MINERLLQTMQRYKGVKGTITNNYMAIKWITWKKWTDPWKIQSSRAEPERNRNYEKSDYKH